jgi:hypothetical protein
VAETWDEAGKKVEGHVETASTSPEKNTEHKENV